MPAVPPESLRSSFIEALRAAYRAGLGVPPELEGQTRAFARAHHDAAVPVEKMIVDIKDTVRAETTDHAMVFMPRIVGWAVAGYFQGSSRERGS